LQTALQYAGNVRPGSWNDMDMSFAGWQDVYGEYGVTDTCTCHQPFTDDESRTELSVLSMMAAPLISGADLRAAADSQHTDGGYTWSTGITGSALAILKNPDMIAIDQDTLAKPATLVGSAPTSPTAPVILERKLANGDTAVAMVNQDPSNWAMPSTTLSALGLSGGNYQYKEIWSGATGSTTGTIGGSWIAPHGVALYRLTAQGGGQQGIVGDGRYHVISAGGTGGQVLEVQGGCGAAVGYDADINAYQSGDPAQQWLFTPNPDGTVQITDNCATSAQTHAVLSAGAQAGNSAYLLNSSPGNAWQEWKVQPGGTGGLTLTNAGNGMVLDVSGSAAGSVVVTNPGNSAAAGQNWTVTA
jgi:alpha-galactosidase